MIPGKRINAIFCILKLQEYSLVINTLQEESIIFLNKILFIVHSCAKKWDCSVNTQYGNAYVMTWKLPTVDDNDNENNESLLEERTEIADKSLITVVKIVCEMRRA